MKDALGHFRKTGGREETTAGESALATSLEGMLYASNAGVISQSNEQLKKMIGVIVVVFMAFDLTIS